LAAKAAMSDSPQRRLVACAVLALTACASGEYRLDAPRTAAGVEIAPYAMHEECIELERGERIGYYFASVAPVSFNIQYHDANAVIMPIVREKVTEGAGDFTADRKEIYCLMWEAGVEPSVLEYRIRPIPARP
jgi:hypothetical protein